MTTTPPSAHLGAATAPDGSALLLRRHGLRCTASRLCALRLLATSGPHYSSAEVCAARQERGLPFDQATVYRTLETFTDVGLAHAVHGPGPNRIWRSPT